MNKNSRKARPTSPENSSKRLPPLRAPGIAILTVSALLTGTGLGFEQQAAPSPETQTLHVLVGKSVLINLETRVRRVMVSNPTVIEATATSPTQVVVTAKTAGTSSLILWDQADRSRMLDVLVDVDVAPLRDAIQQAYPTEPVQVQVVAVLVGFEQLLGNVRHLRAHRHELEAEHVFVRREVRACRGLAEGTTTGGCCRDCRYLSRLSLLVNLTATWFSEQHARSTP